MKKLILFLLFAIAIGSIPIQAKVYKKVPPTGCGFDSNGVKVCCGPLGGCWREDWKWVEQ